MKQRRQRKRQAARWNGCPGFYAFSEKVAHEGRLRWRAIRADLQKRWTPRSTQVLKRLLPAFIARKRAEAKRKRRAARNDP